MYIYEDKFFKIFSTDRQQIQQLFFNIFKSEIDKVGKKLFTALLPVYICP